MSNIDSKNPSLIDQVTQHFQDHPDRYGWILIAIGILIALGSIRKWKWIFEGDGSLFNIAWIAESFGMRTAQVLMLLLGIVFIICGLGFVIYW